MYPMFENIPLTQRKQAYSAIVANNLSRRGYSWAEIDGLVYCPLGVVNKILLGPKPMPEELQSYLSDTELEVFFKMPPNGTVAATILGYLGVRVNREDVRSFMHDIDDGKIATQNDLAVAMGIG
jgi:hypothetical protein